MDEIILFIIIIILNILIFKYLYDFKKHKCDCALTWHRYFILLFTIIYPIIITYISVSNRITFIINNINSIIPVISVYVIIVLLYLVKLNKSKCSCSNNWKKYLLYVQLILSSSSILIIYLTKKNLFNKYTLKLL